MFWYFFSPLDSPQIERTPDQLRIERLSRSKKLSVQERPPPYVKVAAQLGHQLSIECRGSGVPDSMFGWQKHYKPPKNSENGNDLLWTSSDGKRANEFEANLEDKDDEDADEGNGNKRKSYMYKRILDF